MQALNCPNCGAPLTDQSSQKLWLCVYCHSLIRVPSDLALASPTLEKTITDTEIDEVKELLAEGKREDALQVYQKVTGVTREEAEKAVETMTKEYAFGILRRQQLTGFGVLLVTLYALALGLSLLAWVRGVLHPVFAILISAFSAFNLFVFERAIRTSLQYFTAPRANATVRHYTHTGRTKMRGGEVHTFKVLLDVQPQQGQPFRDTLILPVGEKKLTRMQQGLIIQVKYLPGQPNSLLFDGIAE